MKKRLLIALVALNALLALAVSTRASMLPSFAFFDCCQEFEGYRFCCDDCCFFVANCDENEDCF